MGLLNRLFGKPFGPREVRITAATVGDRVSFEVAVRGESNYQPTLRVVKGAAKGPDQGCVVPVFLRSEPDNQHDKNAVMVLSADMRTLGYLSREDAITYGPPIKRLEARGLWVRCHASLYGGTTDKPFIGVWLDMPDPDDEDWEVKD